MTYAYFCMFHDHFYFPVSVGILNQFLNETHLIVNQPSPELKPLMAFFVNAMLCDLNYSLYQRGTDSGGYLSDT